MKPLSLKLFALILIFSIPVLGVAQKRKSRGATQKTLIGYISDSNHGLEHPAGADEVVCTIECAKHGKFVLADRENKVVYQLDQTGQNKAKEFAGQKVRVRGYITGKTMKVIAIEAA